MSGTVDVARRASATGGADAEHRREGSERGGYGGERAGPLTVTRWRRVPPCEPPYDDDADHADVVIPGQLALDWSPAAPAGAGCSPPPAALVGVALSPSPDGLSSAHGLTSPATPAPGDVRPLLADGAGRHGTLRIGAVGSIDAASVRARALAHGRPAVAGVSTDAKIAVHRFVRHCVEVLNGYRPPAHLRRLALPAEAATIVAQGLAGARRVASLRKGTSSRRPSRRPSAAAVMRLRLCQPSTGAVEAAAALVTAERTWALALRLELHHDTWSATALRLI
jgi:hypothetical protein